MNKTGGWLTCRVFEGEDADLINWWNSLHRGEGSAIIKYALRIYLGSGSPGPAPQIPVAPLRAEDDGRELSQSDLAERQAHMLSRKW